MTKDRPAKLQRRQQPTLRSFRSRRENTFPKRNNRRGTLQRKGVFTGHCSLVTLFQLRSPIWAAASRRFCLTSRASDAWGSMARYRFQS